MEIYHIKKRNMSATKQNRIILYCHFDAYFVLRLFGAFLMLGELSSILTIIEDC